MEMLMAEVDEIRRNLRLLNFPTSRDNIVDENESVSGLLDTNVFD